MAEYQTIPEFEVDTATPRPRRSRPLGCLMEVGTTLVLTVVLFFVVTTFIAQPYQVQQLSMRSTLEEGQYVLVDKLTPRFDGYSRGDIVVFNPVRREGSCSATPVAALPDSTPYIKRVIGEPGDTVEVRDDVVYVNGELIAEPYVHGLPTGASSTADSWLVPEGRLFVMGDNRPDSIDSRYDDLGSICINDVVGRAFLRYWPLNKLGILQTPTYGQAPQATVSPATPRPTGSSPTPTGPAATPTTSTAPPAPPIGHLRVEVLGRRPHDSTSYTEGLVMADGRLYESSGYGQATLREVDPASGTILRSDAIDTGYFAEGIAVVDDRLIQLTWQQHTAFVHRLSDFSQTATFSYDTEGWGLCDDGSRLVMSDGTNQLYFRDRTTFELLRQVSVTKDGAPVAALNELECVEGRVYANVWHSDTIMRIDPSSGYVTAEIDASGLLSPEENPGDEEAVLNGIAFDATNGTFLLTGKLWPTLFEVRFVPR